MTGDEFQILLDGVDTEKSTVLDICKNYNSQDSPPLITDEQFNEHPFFQKHFSKQLCAILEFWFSDGSLDENQYAIFRTCSEFLLELTKTHSNIKEWLNQQTELIDLTEKCLNEIGSYGYYIGIGGTEDPNLESFDWLIQSLKNVQCQQLLEIIVKCVTNRFYIDALYRLSNVNALSFTITQHFLLVTCPDYILACDVDKSYCQKVVTKMLGRYNELFSEFLPHIKLWTIPVVLSLIYPMRFILATIRSFAFEQKKLIYQIILTILLNKSTNDSNIEQVRTSLVYTSLCLLIEIIRSDAELSNQLKNKTDEKSDLVNILNDLSKNENNDDIRLKALELTSLLVPEEEFLKDNNTEQVTELFVRSFNEAFEDGKTERVDEILNGLKDLVQNDEVQQEFIKQNGLPSMIKYAKETRDDPLPLEITYAMAFNDDAKEAFRDDKEFVDHVKFLQDSEKKDVSKMAHGIMWKLEGEEKFKKKEAEAKKQKTEESAKDEEKHDMMISYCWAQKEICHKINDRLQKDGYKVWLDRDEMHGSIIERMAEAIERSRFVLICMSSNYKNSTNCKAEAEYAFNRKRKIVPLVVEPSYKADGWLGFLAGSKIYVNFADKEDEEFEKAYNSLTAEIERDGLKDTDEDHKKETTPASSTETLSKPEEPEVPRIDTTEYLNVGPTTQWNEEHVVEFLTDNKLMQLIPICQSMDGEALIEFHHSCRTIPDRMYGLVNNPKEERPVSMGTFYKFIAKFKKYLPPPKPQKLFFKYDFVYPSTNTTTDKESSEQK